MNSTAVLRTSTTLAGSSIRSPAGLARAGTARRNSFCNSCTCCCSDLGRGIGFFGAMAIIPLNYHVVEILAIHAIVVRARSTAQLANRAPSAEDIADFCGAFSLFVKVATMRSMHSDSQHCLMFAV